MQIIQVAIDDLIAYENNPRNNDCAVDAVAESIKQFGFKVPIIVDAGNVIVAGHTRLKAAKQLGMDNVPCIVASDLSPEQIKAFRLADNKVSELAEWDMEKLECELLEMKQLDVDFDMQDFGFDMSSLEEEPEVVEDDVPEVDEQNEPTAKVGDVWQLGRHRLMCGDSTIKEDVLRLMDGASADLVVTDPPYNVAYEGATADAMTIENDNMSSADFNAFLTNAFANIEMVLKQGASFYIWFASREHINFEDALNKANLVVRQELIWCKNTFVLGRQDYQWKHEPCLYGWKDGASHNWYSDRSQTTLLEFSKPTRNGEHPTMKPIELFGYLVKNSSKKGDKVVDLFGGSGTTIIACEQLDRECYTMEFDPRYVDVIIKRWENLTGNKAQKLN